MVLYPTPTIKVVQAVEFTRKSVRPSANEVRQKIENKMSYPKNRKMNVVVGSSIPSSFDEFAEEHQPYYSLSYFLNGGVDADGSHLRADAAISHDTEEDLANDVDGIAIADPTVGFFELAEELGAVEAANQMVGRTPTGTYENIRKLNSLEKNAENAGDEKQAE